MNTLLTCSLLIAAAIPISRYLRRRPAQHTVAIIVLGDVGRSPRMMYHAESFAKLGFRTYLIGYRGSKPVPSLTSLPHVHLHYLPEPPTFVGKVSFGLSALVKIVYQTFSILYTLMFSMTHPPEFIVVQNPPSIPTLALVWLVGRVRATKVIIDWHNLGHSILALKLGHAHPFVMIAKRRFEKIFGRSAYAHLFVTEAMRDHLVNDWNLVGKMAVLYDRPPSHFHRCLPPEVHELFIRLGPSLKDPVLKDFLPKPNAPYSTEFTTTSWPSRDSRVSSLHSQINMPKLREDRVALLISSTSWTPDEDFNILLEALALYEERARTVNNNLESSSSGKLPKIWMVITGKGPLRTMYMSRVLKLQEQWEFVRCSSLWLEAEDYPLLLGSADLGICLHASSSALDLPMKVVDMFGCGLPVCALDFKCLPELVKGGRNGMVFKGSGELANQMEALLKSFPNSARLEALRSSLREAAKLPDALLSSDSVDGEWCSWADNWNRTVKPLVLRDE
ncbi:glycosyltransferase family 33 protein [Pisolithus tinctorius]|nr:glycosyltransferase family 33 protein [Pisolithus tinctorius]